MTDPNLQLGGWGEGFFLYFALSAFPSVISSVFTQNRGGGGVSGVASSSKSTTTRSLLVHDRLIIVI